MGIQNNSATWVTTIYKFATMSRLVSFLMLLSLMMVVNTMPGRELVSYALWDCPDGTHEVHHVPDHPDHPLRLDGCVPIPIQKREAIDAPRVHKTKRVADPRCPSGQHSCYDGSCCNN